MSQTACPGCGALLPVEDGPVHAYMTSSPACWARYNVILAAEYSDADLMRVHRLSVDTFAIQHPGANTERREIQSVGLHLARLMFQLEGDLTPEATTNLMLRMGERKSTLTALQPPARFSITTADVAPFAGGPKHAETVREWARATFDDWSDHHAFIRRWANDALGG